MRAGLVALIVIVVVAAVVALNALFVVTPTQQALVLQFGEVRQAIREPGLSLKIPLVQDVLFLDKRNLDLNVPAQEIIAADQKRLVVDAFMRYRITNPVRFYQTVNNVREGAARLSTFVQASLRAVLADATFQAIVRDDRPQLMQRIREDVADRAADIGVQVVDVRIRRADLPTANSEAIYRRMQTEREQEAREIRAQGEEAARRIRAAADRTATVLRAEAQREADQIRGEGDAQKSAIFARAYTRDPEFFAFYRAMQAYEAGLRSQDTRLVLAPQSQFFRFFGDSRGGAGDGGMPPPEGEATSGAPVPPDAAAAPAGQARATGPAGDENAAVDPAGDSPPVSAPALSEALEGELDVEALDPSSDGAPTPEGGAALPGDAAGESGEAAEASTAAAVRAARPPTSPAADAAALGEAGVQPATRGSVTIVRPGDEAQ